ncbi:major facilitator superfamily domain-containing protein [Dipodascopsis tothii]|uniref:major facilitator superfamily domain-containing protein n=1 Tax=Dipodascopsis tothii TaxID=44089 RepID=UPI0034CFAE23
MALDDDTLESTHPLQQADTISLLDDEQKIGGADAAEVLNDLSDPPAVQEELSRSALVTVFCSLYVGVFLSALDGTIVATLLAHIASEFHEFRSVSWIATGYLIAQAAVQPLYGKVSDVFGRKPVVLFSNVLFGVGSVLCGLSNSIWFLVFARVIAGIGGAGLTSMSAITLSDIVPLRQRGLLQGIGNILYGSGAAFGGIVGGIITDRFGWRWTFLSQGPIILLSIAAIYFNLNLPKKHVADSGDKLKRIDFLGSLTMVCGLVLFLFAVSIGGSYQPWLSFSVIAPLVISFFFIGAFVYVELYVAAEPVIPLRLLKNRTVAGSSFTSWFLVMVYYAHIFYIAIYSVSVRGVSPTRSGSSLIPHFVASAAGSLACGAVMRSTGRYYRMIILASCSSTIGAILIASVGRETSQLQVMAYMLFPGFGFGVYLTVTLVGLIAAVPREYQAVTTSIQYGFRGIGSTVGVSVASAVFQNVLAAKLTARITGENAAEIIRRVSDSVDEVANLPEDLRDSVIQSYLDSCHAVFYMAVVLIICCAGSSLCMKEYVLHNNVSRR